MYSDMDDLITPWNKGALGNTMMEQCSPQEHLFYYIELPVQRLFVYASRLVCYVSAVMLTDPSIRHTSHKSATRLEDGCVGSFRAATVDNSLNSGAGHSSSLSRSLGT